MIAMDLKAIWEMSVELCLRVPLRRRLAKPQLRHIEVFRDALTAIIQYGDVVLRLGNAIGRQWQPFLIRGLVIAAFVGGDAGRIIGAGRHPRHEQDGHNQKANDSTHNPAIIAPSIS